MPSRIAIDIDNTIADINKTLLGFVPGFDVKEYPNPRVTTNTFKKNPWIFTNSPPIEGAVEALNRISLHWEIVYLTARPKWARRITQSWLAKHGFPSGRLVLTENKKEAVIELGINLAIDDSPCEIRSLSKIIPVLIYAQPYNQMLEHLGKRISWTETNWEEEILTFCPDKELLSTGDNRS